MQEFTLKRKKHQKSSRLTQIIGNFIATHVKSGEGEGVCAKRRRYIFICTRLILGSAFSALISRSQLAFSTYPFGIMFLCASGRSTPVYALASLISYLTLGPISRAYAALCALILLCRSAACMYLDAKQSGTYSFPRYNEWVAYRVIISCIASFISGLYNLFFFSFSYYSLLGSILCMIACPLGTYIFSVASDKGASEDAHDASRLFMCAVFVWALAPISLLGLDPGRIAAFCLVVSASDEQKKGSSALVGLVCGLPFGISSCAVYAISGAVCATLKTLSEFLSELGAFTFILMAEGYIGGYSALLDALPESAIGLCAVIVWRKYELGEQIYRFSLCSLTRKTRERKTEPEPCDTRGINEISRAFSSLSSTLRALSRRTDRSVLLDTNGICEAALECVCFDCPSRVKCIDTHPSDAADAQAKLSCAVSRDGKITQKSLPTYITKVCTRKGALVREVNRRIARATEECFERSGTELLSSDYASMAKILDSHLSRLRERDRYDRECSASLLSMCRRKMYGISRISVYGERNRRIYASGIDLASHSVSAAELKKEFESVCGRTLSTPVYTIDGSDIEFEMHTEQRFSAECAIAALPKENEEHSGDSARSFANSEGYFYGILCDGMGSGESAAYTSGICAEYLTSMLSCSNPKELTLEMLNSVLRCEKGENSSTVDIFELDLFTGEGCFLKSGAAPSYVCRGSNVYRVSAKTIPIGITDKIGAEKIKFRLKPGDTVVIVSDGIVESEGDGRLVVETLCRRTTDDPFDIAASVLCAARSKHGMRDDMTVVCVSVNSTSNS